MGKRKRLSAEKRKEERKDKYFAVLRNYPSSPRKMRLVVDMVRGKDVETALNILTYSPQAAATTLKKLLLSAIANWEQK
ncbi:MAG: uL22 family ribosomal protein, partial [Bacteroidota bacterium]|nr:uL22 family ribosomal protein [Bacteroidota bacterium]